MARLSRLQQATLLALALVSCGPERGDEDSVRGPRLLAIARSMALVRGGAYAQRPFFLQRFEVTKGEYLRFVEESGYRGEDPNGFLWDMWPDPWEGSGAPPYFDHRGNADEPVVWITRGDAEAYLKHIGLRLPSQHEWIAAFATHIERLEIEKSRPSVSDYYANTREAGVNDPVPVGFFDGDRTSDGCFDLVGNVSEWVLGMVYSLSNDAADQHYLLIAPERFIPLLECVAALSGNPGAGDAVGRTDCFLNCWPTNRHVGKSFNYPLMSPNRWRWRSDPKRRVVDLLVDSKHEGVSANFIGFRGAIDAVKLVNQIAEAVLGDLRAEAEFQAWLGMLDRQVILFVLGEAQLREGAPRALLGTCIRELESR